MIMKYICRVYYLDISPEAYFFLYFIFNAAVKNVN